MSAQPPPPRVPRVSIGMPVYNGAVTLRSVLDSLFAQTFEDFELIVSDNASDDETEEICREYAARDARVRYVRQPRNLGAAANFGFVLREARGEYFMWAAADDTRSSDYVAVNLEFLESHPDYVASTSPVRFADGLPDGRAMGDASLDQTRPEARFLAFFDIWHANGRYYSLFRRESLVAVASISGPQYLGSDWTIILELLRDWRFHRSDAGEVVLGRGGISNSADVFRAHRSSRVELLLPFWKLTWATMHFAEDMPLRARAQLLGRLAHRNYQALVAQSKHAVHRCRGRR
ncbi:MAG: glycosyltransferase [Actinobacteria bacterium]|nr:glycosyltransferase [Actinomycetota bacterium]